MMQFRLDATPDELEEKSGKLVEHLSDLFRSVAPELSELLEKALPAKEQELKYPVLRALKKKTDELYAKHMKQMVDAIGEVLDEGVEKSLEKGGPVAAKYDHTKPVHDKDAIAYKRVRQVLIRMGWEQADFEPGGPLFGWSTNQLLDLAREKKTG